MKRKYFLAVGLVVGILMLNVGAQEVWAGKCSGVDTNIINCDSGENGVYGILNLILMIMTFGVGTLATLGLVWSGIEYLMAADSLEKAIKAKRRIGQIGVGLLAYAMLAGFLDWIMPGGMLKGIDSNDNTQVVNSQNSNKGSGSKNSKNQQEKDQQEESKEIEGRMKGSEEIIIKNGSGDEGWNEKQPAGI